MTSDPEQVLALSRWIWIDSDPDEPNVWAYFRRGFEVQSTGESWLNITADLRYVAWVNGRMVGFGPPKYHIATPTVDRYPLAAFLAPGANVICVRVYSMGRAGEISSCMPRRGAMLAGVEVDGRVIASDRTEKSRGRRRICKRPCAEGKFSRTMKCLMRSNRWGSRGELNIMTQTGQRRRESQKHRSWSLGRSYIPLIPWTCRPPDRLIEMEVVRFIRATEAANVADVVEQIAIAQRTSDQDHRITLHPTTSDVRLDASAVPLETVCYARWDFGSRWTGYPAIKVAGPARKRWEIQCGLPCQTAMVFQSCHEPSSGCRGNIRPERVFR